MHGIPLHLLPTLALLAAAFFAGLVDAVVGGGGLIQLPALFSVMPRFAPAIVFGTNKLASFFGTAFATVRYAQRIEAPWRLALPAALTAFVFSYLGAKAVVLLPKDVIRPVVLVLLIVVTLYTWLRKDLGTLHERRRVGRSAMALAALCGAVMGFYDGFFGPGTGSFLIFIFIRFFGLDFLHASLTAKLVNVSTNLAALLCFGLAGQILYPLGLLMAAFNIGGSIVGSHLALRHGSGFVRRVFLLVAGALILKFGYDTIGSFRGSPS